MKWVVAFSMLAAVLAISGPSTAGPTDFYSTVSVRFDPALRLTSAQQDDLSSAVAAQLASRIALSHSGSSDDWVCVHPPSVQHGAAKNEAIYNLLTLEVSAQSTSIQASVTESLWGVKNQPTLASYNLPIEASQLGQGAALAGALEGLISSAVNMVLAQAHPCRANWTGKIQFRAEDHAESHTELSDSSNYRLVDITITVTDGVAVAHTHAEHRATSEGRAKVANNVVVTIVKDSWSTVTMNGDGDSDAAVRVMVDPARGTYTISVTFKPITAREHKEGCSRGHTPCPPSPDVENLITWGWPTTWEGRTDDPSHLQGRVPLLDFAGRTAFENWDLHR